MPIDIADLSARLEASGLSLLDSVGVTNVIPVGAAWMATSCTDNDGRVDRIFDFHDPGLVRKANEAWYALALEYELFDESREFLLSCTLSCPDESLDVRWMLVRLKSEWDIIGTGSANGVLGGPYGRPGFVMLSKVGYTVVAGTTWQDGISVLMVPNPHLASGIRRYMANAPKELLSEEECINIRQWLSRPARRDSSNSALLCVADSFAREVVGWLRRPGCGLDLERTIAPSILMTLSCWPGAAPPGRRSRRGQDEGRRTVMGQRVCVTGASGQAGRAVVRELREHGYDVVPADIAVTRQDLEAGMLRADLTDYGQALDAVQGPEATWWAAAAAGQLSGQLSGALRGTDAVVHLANIPGPQVATPAVTFSANMTMNFNVFMAAARLGVSRVVWASSETTLGLPFEVPPRYAPVDEDHYPVPTTAYALSKVASETIAGHIAQWSGIPFIALRFSNIMAPADYQDFPSFWPGPSQRKWNLWGYVDERDVAAACRLALSAPQDAVAGSPGFIIAAADTVMNRPSAGHSAAGPPASCHCRYPCSQDVLLAAFGTPSPYYRTRRTFLHQPHPRWTSASSASSYYYAIPGATTCPRKPGRRADNPQVRPFRHE